MWGEGPFGRTVQTPAISPLISGFHAPTFAFYCMTVSSNVHFPFLSCFALTLYARDSGLAISMVAVIEAPIASFTLSHHDRERRCCIGHCGVILMRSPTGF